MCLTIVCGQAGRQAGSIDVALFPFFFFSLLSVCLSYLQRRDDVREAAAAAAAARLDGQQLEQIVRRQQVGKQRQRRLAF